MLSIVKDLTCLPSAVRSTSAEDDSADELFASDALCMEPHDTRFSVSVSCAGASCCACWPGGESSLCEGILDMAMEPSHLQVSAGQFGNAELQLNWHHSSCAERGGEKLIHRTTGTFQASGLREGHVRVAYHYKRAS